MFVVTWGDISYTPGSFELKLRHVIALEEWQELGNQISVDNLLNWWVFLEGEQAAEANASELGNQNILHVN